MAVGRRVASLTPIRRHSLSDAVAAELRTAIRGGRYRPGQRLVQEDLAAALEVSRTPLRQALAQLAREGLVEASAAGYRVMTLEVRHALDMFEVGAAIEAHAARLAALHADERALDRLERAARTAPLRPSGDPVASPTEFHDLIAQAAGNPALARLRPIALAAIELPFADAIALASPETEEQSHAEHAQICAALRARDSERAAALAGAHVREGARRAAEALSQLTTPHAGDTRARSGRGR